MPRDGHVERAGGEGVVALVELLLDGGEDDLGGVDVAVERHVDVRPERRLPGRRARGIDDTRLHGQNVGTLGHPPARDVALRRRDLLALLREIGGNGPAQAGIGECVAPLGTALTEQQIIMLWRMTPKPLLCFDGDSAGQKAAMRAALRAAAAAEGVPLPEGVYCWFSGPSFETPAEIRAIAPVVAEHVLVASHCPTDGSADPSSTVLAFVVDRTVEEVVDRAPEGWRAEHRRASGPGVRVLDATGDR